jgi:peptidoglycan/xylan/chitin deacetylase (PgdA/CDA1 family)
MSILVCHHITPRWIGVSQPDTRAIEKFSRYRRETGIHFVTLSQYIAKMDEPAQKRVALTFDDGYSDIETIALSICREFGVVATVFVLPLYAANTIPGTSIGSGKRFAISIGHRSASL